MSNTFRVRTGASTAEASADLSRMYVEWFTKHGPNPIFKSCQNCQHMQINGPAFCLLYKLTPPCDIIISGCESHEDTDDIPF